jgi:diguanylate cyclase (GGDEF)-like protein
VPASRRSVVGALALAGIVTIGVIDYLTGVEYRVYPLYFLPLSLAAWHLGRRGAVTGALLCSCSWLASNYAAGLRYSSPAVWPFNLVMQSTAFLTVGLLIATLRSALQREAQLGRTDPLTGLLNRRAFYQAAEQILATGERHNHAVTLAYLDLDNFKVVNDTLGHERGDVTLRRLADLLRQCTRLGDVSARLGGDEFVVLLPQTGPDGAAALLERLRALLAAPFADIPDPISLSIGAVSFTAPPPDVEHLVRQADAAMYVAKLAGKNRVTLQAFDRALQMVPLPADAS